MLTMLNGASFGASLLTQNPKSPGPGASNWRPVEHWPPGSLCFSYGVAWSPSTPCDLLPPQTNPESQLQAGSGLPAQVAVCQCQQRLARGGGREGGGSRRHTDPAGVVPSLTSIAGSLTSAREPSS